MIQLNLLPDVKLEYIRAQKQRKLIMSLSVLAVIISVGLTVLLLVISTIEKARISSLSGSIDDKVKELREKPQIDKILTVQNQLNSLTDLHAAKPAVTNVNGILNEVTPEKLSISTFTINYAEKKISISGDADTLSSVNKYIDTLKFTKFNTDKVKDMKQAFSGVVMTDYGVNQDARNPNQAVNYTIEMAYDEALFDITQKLRLEVPSQVTTRSELDRPADNLFKASEKAEEEGEE